MKKRSDSLSTKKRQTRASLYVYLGKRVKKY